MDQLTITQNVQTKEVATVKLVNVNASQDMKGKLALVNLAQRIALDMEHVNT
jgi:hypothetical protein